MARSLTDAVRCLLDGQHGVVTRAQLHTVGVSDRTIATWVRRGRLIRVAPGCLVDSDRWSAATAQQRHLMRLLGVQLSAPDSVARAATSAISWGLPVRSIPSKPAVIRGPDASPLTSASVQRRALDREHICRRQALATLSLAHTVVDVASVVPLPDALITLDAARRRGLPLGRLQTALEQRGTFAGVDRARLALTAGDPASESPLESLSRGRVIELGLPLPLCNVVIRKGGRVARVDKLWVEDGVVGEADGNGKYANENASEVIWDEKRRHDWLEELGFAVPRWGWPEVADDGAALERRYHRAVGKQRASGFRWPVGVTVDVRQPLGIELPPRVVAEVDRLARAGYPVQRVAVSRWFGGSPALWTPRSA